LWQVSGRSHTRFEDRADYDSWYVRNWSLWVDWVILLKTVRVVLSGRGAM
jgi:undecaprenyl-phosphate galactose phosphotransferase